MSGDAITTTRQAERVLVRHGFLELTNADGTELLLKGSSIQALSPDVNYGTRITMQSAAVWKFYVKESVTQILEAITASYQQARGSR